MSNPERIRIYRKTRMLNNMNKIVALSKVSSKNLVAIPIDVMVLLNLVKGDKIIWLTEDNRVYIKKVE